MSGYTGILSEVLAISNERALLVEAHLRLQYGTLCHLSQERIRFEYTDGGISEVIDLAPDQAVELAKSMGLH